MTSLFPPSSPHSPVWSPPIKTQGRKFRLIAWIRRYAPAYSGRWVEPFMGSGSVAFNVAQADQEALLADNNPHLIAFYQAIQQHQVTPASVWAHCTAASPLLASRGRAYFEEIRARFNRHYDPHDFLLLSRLSFNGLVRFNRQGDFNASYSYSPHRLSPPAVVALATTIGEVQARLPAHWQVVCQPFEQTLAAVGPTDAVYCDPPYWGLHTQYYTPWTPACETCLIQRLQGLAGPWLLSTWSQSGDTTNPQLAQHWPKPAYEVLSYEHTYRIGPTLQQRPTVTEALIRPAGQAP